MADDSLSPEDLEYLAKCEEQFKDRYTEKDEEFMKVFSNDPPKPPILESWWVPQSYGRRNDRRNNRRQHPYERPDNRARDNNDRRDHRDNRGYNDYRGYNDRRHGYNDRRTRY